MSNVVLRSDDVAEDLGIVIGIARRNAMLDGPKVVLTVTDRLVLAGLFVPGATVNEESILRAERIMEREQQYIEGYGAPDAVQLPENYERWGFRCTVSRKAEVATVFFYGRPVMYVDPEDWVWIYDPEIEDRTENTPWNEAVQNAADALENYGIYPCTEEEREEQQGYGITGLVEYISETFLR